MRQEILQEHSKRQAMHIAAYIGDDPDRFDELIQYMLSSEVVLCQRAAYAFMVCVDQQPALVIPHLETLIDYLQAPPSHPAVTRNVIRALQSVPIPEELMGKTADVCFALLASEKEPIAVRAFSMTVLYAICLHYPELSGELRVLIEDMLPYGTPAIRSRGKKILKNLMKV